MRSNAFVPSALDDRNRAWSAPERGGETQPSRAMFRMVRADTDEPGLRRKRRTQHAPTFQLTERDIQVLRALYRLRVLDRPQIERLFFPNWSLTCRRLRYLYLHGYIERLYRPPISNGGARGPAYRVGERGAHLLADEQGLTLAEFSYWGKRDDRRHHKTERTPAYLDHALALSDFRIAMEQAATTHQCTISLWRDDVDIHREHLANIVQVRLAENKPTQPMTLMPDGYFTLTTPDGRTGHFFVEVDRSTESVRTKWQRKIVGYKALFTSGLFHQTYQVREQATAFRVLVTTPSPERAAHLKAAAERYGDAGASPLFLVAPVSLVATYDALATPIWHRGGSQELTRLL